MRYWCLELVSIRPRIAIEGEQSTMQEQENGDIAGTTTVLEPPAPVFCVL